MSRSYVVRVPLEVTADRWFDLCRCLTPEAAAEVLCVLLRRAAQGPYEYRVSVEGWDDAESPG